MKNREIYPLIDLESEDFLSAFLNRKKPKLLESSQFALSNGKSLTRSHDLT
jgi:hypothetical protein